MGTYSRRRSSSTGHTSGHGSLLSAEDLRALEAFHEGATGYFGKMFSYIVDFVRKGVKEGRFTEEQARTDLQIALWYSYKLYQLDLL